MRHSLALFHRAGGENSHTNAATERLGYSLDKSASLNDGLPRPRVSGRVWDQPPASVDREPTRRGICADSASPSRS